MAGTTSSIISNLMSTIQRLSQYMHHFSSPAACSSSLPSTSMAGEEVTAAEVDSIQEILMEDLNRLWRMLRRIQAVLHDAEEREIYDQTIQLWLSELREVAYDAEDVLDEYDYQVIKTQVEGMTAAAEAEAEAEAEQSLKRKRVVDDDDDLYDFQVCPSSSTSIKIPISCDMAVRIMKIVKKFDEIAKDRDALHLREEDGVRRPTFDDAMKRPPSSSLVNDLDVFGREDDKKKIIQLLMSGSEKENTVIPIVGLGGVGKTTLAQFVYNDPVVCEHFSPKVWICISEEFDVVRITKEIVTSIIGHHDNYNLNDLQRTLKEALLEKRFLLILDDIWNERPDMWEVLRAPFSGVGMGKVIVTTRSMSVARIMQTVPPHELGCLDEEKSWLMFQRHAFCGWEFDQQLNFEQIGREITKKCGGLPLALKAIGGFLRYEVDEQIWKDVLNNNLWELEETKNLILPALRISYNHLPAHLKPCFLYASLFPKDYEFEKIELVKMWIAQGYIQLTKRNRLMEDIAFECLEDLHRRSFFQDSKYDKCFTLHDMMHDLARSITRNEICSFLDFDDVKNIPEATKHIFMKKKEVDHVGLSGAIRTFYSTFDSLDYLSSTELLQNIFLKELFPHFGCLRVLRLILPGLKWSLQFIDLIGNLQQLRHLFIIADSIQMGKYSLCSLHLLQSLELILNELNMLPCAIGKLINLRHLVLHCSSLEELPKSICQLKNLLTLDIDRCYEIRELPLGISKLTNLRHLILPHIFTFNIPCEIEKMTSLHTLPHYYLGSNIRYSGIGGLKNLMNLRGILWIHGLGNVVNLEDAKSANLQSKPHIERLTLYWEYNRKDNVCTKQEEAIIEGLQPHTNLKELIISGYGGKSLPSWLSQRSIETENKKKKKKKRMGQDVWCYPPHDGMLEWKEWSKMNNGDFSSLKYLHIGHCHNLEMILTLPSSLEEFVMQSCYEIEYVALDDLSGPLSKLQKVAIEHCHNLKSVNSLNNLLATLNFLSLSCCPLLHPNPNEYSSLASLSLQKANARATRCPGMKEWCQCYGFDYE